MSMLPLIVDLARNLSSAGSRIPIYEDSPFDDDFGLALYPQEIRRLTRTPSTGMYVTYPRYNGGYNRYSPYSISKKGKNKKENINIGKDGFQVCIDVEQFQPNELSVKTIDNTVVVEGKHEEREDEHGSIYRHFIRKYTLPKDYDPKDVVSTVSSDGVLCVKAQPKIKNVKGAERVIQIQHTGPAHTSVKDNTKGAENGEKMDKMES